MTVSLIAPIAVSLIQPVASSLINAISGKEQEGRFLPSLALLLMKKYLGKGVTRARRGYHNMNHMKKVTSLRLMVFFQETIYLE